MGRERQRDKKRQGETERQRQTDRKTGKTETETRRGGEHPGRLV